MSMLTKTVLALSLLISAPALAASSLVTINNVYCNSAPAGASIPVFFTSKDSNPSDTIISASSSVAQTTSLMIGTTNMQSARFRGSQLTMAMSPYSMRMESVVPATTGSTPQQHWTHVMLIRLKQKLIKGTTFPLTLNFKDAGTVKVLVTVH